MIQTTRFRLSAQTELGAARTGAAHLPSPGRCNDKFPPRTWLERHRCALKHSRMLKVTRCRASLLTCNFCRYSLHSRIDTADRGHVQRNPQLLSVPPKWQTLCTLYPGQTSLNPGKRRRYKTAPARAKETAADFQQHPRSAGLFYAALSSLRPESCASHPRAEDALGMPMENPMRRVGYRRKLCVRACMRRVVTQCGAPAQLRRWGCCGGVRKGRERGGRGGGGEGRESEFAAWRWLLRVGRDLGYAWVVSRNGSLFRGFTQIKTAYQPLNTHISTHNFQKSQKLYYGTSFKNDLLILNFTQNSWRKNTAPCRVYVIHPVENWIRRRQRGTLHI